VFLARASEYLRINSQSGKGGVAYILEQELGLQLPRWLQTEFSLTVQRLAEQRCQEISSVELLVLFKENYLQAESRYQLVNFSIEHKQQDVLHACIKTATDEINIMGTGEGAMTAFVNALKNQWARKIEIVHYDEHALTTGTESEAVCYIQLNDNGVLKTGVACHKDIVSASLNAVLKSMSVR